MQSAERVLDVLRERGRRGLPLNELYRQLFNPQLYLLAYGRVYSNKGAMTPGADAETADGMTLGKIERIIDALRHERYRFKPVKRVYIPKKDGKQRPLGLPSWSDKLVGEVIRLLLEAYYEPQFSDRSHGYRPNRGCHTALCEVARKWTGTTWFIEGDISQCFDKLDHQVTLKTLAKRSTITGCFGWSGRCCRPGTWKTGSGTPRSAARRRAECSPDPVQRVSGPVGQIRRDGSAAGTHPRCAQERNPEYKRVENAASRARQRGDHAAVRALRKQQRNLPSQDPLDPDFQAAALRQVR